MNVRILWAAIIGFFLGVGVRSLVPLSWPWALFAVLLGGLAAAVALFDVRLRRPLTVAAIAFLCVGCGIGRTALAVQPGDSAITSKLGQTITLQGAVVAEPDIRESGVRLTMHAISLLIGSSSVPIDATVLVLAPPHAGAGYGDVIRAKGELQLPQSFDSGDGRIFQYPLFLAKDGVLYELAFAQVSTTGAHAGNPITVAAIAAKHLYIGGLGAVLPEPEAGFAGGITVGDKRSIGSDLSATFQKVSLIHMVVLSGYNITVVINAAASLLAWAGRTAQFGGSAAVVVFFILIAGGASSAVRAGAMALLAMYARVSGRTFIALRALAVTCFAMVLWNPYTLLFDPSFQLSALATVGLVLFTPIIAERLRFVPERFGLREIISSTIGTQLVVLPFLLYQNGMLSLVALPANLFALIPVPIAMLASFVAALGGMAFGSMATALALPAYVVLAYVIAVARIFASVPFATISIPAFSAWWLVPAYGVLGIAYLHLNKKTAGKVPAAQKDQ